MPNPLGGGTVDVTQRQCMPGMKAFAGNCMDQTQAIMRKQMSVNMCACDSDQCNSSTIRFRILEVSRHKKFDLKSLKLAPIPNNSVMAYLC